MENLRPCPFCGKIHKVSKIAPVTNYDDDGKPILGEYKDLISLESHRYNTYIPFETWQSRPLEDALQRKLEMAKNLLKRFRQWDQFNDMIAITSDGPYWKREFDEALQKLENKEE